MRKRAYLQAVALAFIFLAGNGQVVADEIVINEIHYDPEDETSAVEFIELHNSGATTLDLSGWSFDEGVSYTFPAGTTIAPDGYLVVGEDPATLQAVFGVAALGPWIRGIKKRRREYRAAGWWGSDSGRGFIPLWISLAHGRTW